MHDLVKTTIYGCISSALCLVAASSASAKTLTVNAADNIYGVGQTSAPGGGNVPTGFIKIGKGAQCLIIRSVLGSLSCTAADGCVTLNGGGNLNDPDGVGAGTPTSSNSGYGSISGISAPYAGYLVAVFTPAGGPSGTAPAALDYTQTGTGFKTEAALLDQVFFVGDGKIGDDTGKRQQFVVPAGAKTLTFGISDACNYNGGPGCYGDNTGSYAVKVETETTPCK